MIPVVTPEDMRAKVRTVETALSHVPNHEQIKRLQTAVAEMPQPEFETVHYFVPGMYCRVLKLPADTVLVGKTHKKPHFFLCTAGEVIAWSETGMRHMKPGDVIESQPGTKRALYALKESIITTVHKTNKRNLDKIEAELIEPEADSLYDAANVPRIQADVKRFMEIA